MKRQFTSHLCDKYLGKIAEGIESDPTLYRKKGAVATAETLLRQLVGEEIRWCQSRDYVLLDNGPGIAKVALWCDQAEAFGVKVDVKIAYVQSWRSAFDMQSPAFIGDYRRCQDGETVTFLDKIRELIQNENEFVNDPLSSTLVLEVGNWSSIQRAAHESTAWVKGASQDFHKSIEGVLQRRLDKGHMPKSVSALHPDINYILRAFRAIALRYNTGAKQTGLYAPIKIPKYVLCL